jgi:hypothetical protein
MRSRARPTVVKSQPPDVSFRVLRLPESLREGIRRAKQSDAISNRQWLTNTIEAHLPNLVEELEQMEIHASSGPTRPVRFPFDNAALAALRAASETTGLPAITLLRVCFARAIAGQGSHGAVRSVRGKRASRKGRR